MVAQLFTIVSNLSISILSINVFVKSFFDSRSTVHDQRNIEETRILDNIFFNETIVVSVLNLDDIRI